ncbi:hypothetical protein THMA_0512 [Thermotoga maritima MSB8]|uniref:Uncharacterized protein n=1 Tax=Thermotoga maritima (strain ATCC 43589 / DSM 3109 / JCM 10099 / NBRC 100826 / MSB8) TaxID=243274 RepID=Q9WYW9_THEMA|nr:hypothetical protein [Thermotoga maritima]AAD35584.1 hypothetical protein TM_0499 [Thermotoga maritima MSB8]AGL49421.1 hypothetical protein Tmari_0496 [Thermotoga maritima MSB8]AHD17744.1 hypothetical protein THEMA_02175 [Thermotoga maritima MSB8]AKE26421.1 hypothetical protein THMC_0512 [Thermotoga maritima]AKE28286.1 hypothetical protein THMA_0512 [Thermotoga maritima MSB8]
MRRYWLVILLIAIVILFFRVKWEVKRIYVEDPEVKKMVEEILREKRYRYKFTDTRERSLIIEKDRAIVPPNEVVLHLDWPEKVKKRVKELVEPFFQKIGLSATESQMATAEVFLEAVIESFFEGNQSLFENSYYCGEIYVFSNGKCVAEYDPSTGELVFLDK